MPLRPIVSSIFSITSGAEQYLLKILKPLVEKCKFSLSSTKVFKEKFMKITQNFTNFYEIFNIDATSLYTSINVPRVIDHIVSEIYTDPDSYFNDNNLGSFPPKNIFKDFIIGILLEFNTFETLQGYYRQKEGLSMGGKLSSAISNIFLNMLECEIIQGYLDQNILLFYGRYVDDCLLIVRKRYKNIILSKMNEFDSFLKFTSEKMQENSIKFLDTTVFINNSELQLKRFFKHENVVINYKKLFHLYKTKIHA